MNLDGTWRVKVISGPLWFRALNLIRDRKIIRGSLGYNIASGFTWGKFTISYRNTEIVLKYIEQPIIDKLRVVDKDKLSGKFFWKDNYVGDFEMTRRKGE